MAGSAALVLVTGIMRVYLEKGTDVLPPERRVPRTLELFVVVALLSIYPTVVFLRWRARDPRRPRTRARARPIQEASNDPAAWKWRSCCWRRSSPPGWRTGRFSYGVFRIKLRVGRATRQSVEMWHDVPARCPRARPRGSRVGKIARFRAIMIKWCQAILPTLRTEPGGVRQEARGLLHVASSVSRSTMKLACRMGSTRILPISGSSARPRSSSLARRGETRGRRRRPGWRARGRRARRVPAPRYGRRWRRR